MARRRRSSRRLWLNATRVSPRTAAIAYTATDNGRQDVYVTGVVSSSPTLTVGGGPWRVSSGGGSAPRWRADGREIFYAGPTSMMAAPVSTDSGFAAGTPVTVGGGAAGQNTFGRFGFIDVSRDGRELLFARPATDLATDNRRGFVDEIVIRESRHASTWSSSSIMRVSRPSQLTALTTPLNVREYTSWPSRVMCHPHENTRRAPGRAWSSTAWAVPDEYYDVAIIFHCCTRCLAVRQASACAVSVGLRAPLVPMTLAPRMPRFGTSCEKPSSFTTAVSGFLPIRVPP